MNEAIDNLEFGRVDEHHPKLVEKYRKRSRIRANIWLASMAAYTNNVYYGHGL
jgi:hypothetical protein